MSNEYTHQILRIVVAQICQTIGWHSIQSTPLELLVDILHKYLQEITRETYRYTELYGRIEPNLDDVGLAFRDLNIHLPDIEEYINYVDSVNCSFDVPKYPIHKESNLNFLKPGSKEVLTRPVHVHEHLPPIYPDKEVNGENEQNDAENSCDNIVHNSHENGIFKKPEITEGPISKKPRFAFEEEGRPTREISSVMMTSSGFISPAREGKLPDAKSPILPETKQITKSPSPAPNTNSTSAPLPVSSMENKFDKKIKKKSALLASGGEKEKKRVKAPSLGIPPSSGMSVTKVMNGTNHHHHDVHHIASQKQKLLMKKKKDKEKKHKDHSSTNHVLSERSIGNLPASGGGNEIIKGSSKSDMINSSSAGIKTEHQFSGHHSLPLPSSNTTLIDIEVKPKIDKLSSEPDKQKLNIFKKISSSKKDRDDLNKSPSIYPDNQILSSIPEGTTITPAPPLTKSSHSTKNPDSDNVICIDDEPSMSITKISSNYSKLPPHQAANVISQNLEAFGTTATPTPKSQQTQRKPRKNKAHQQQQQQLDQSMPLNLSNSNPINMVKKDILQNSKLPYSNSHKTPKLKKERKNKTKQKELKKDLQHPNNLQDFTSNIRNALNPLQSMFPGSNHENHPRPSTGDNPFLPNNKDMNSLNSKLGKIDSLLKQGAATAAVAGASGGPPPSTPYGPPPNFSAIPTIPMFPFYPFPPRPGLIPSTSLFSPLQPMADNPSFKQYLPMMRFDFNNVHKGTRLGSKFDDELPPPPLPSVEGEKGYCNVAPLVPDSMKFQLSPPRYSSSAGGAGTTNQKTSSGIGGMGSSYDGFSSNGGIMNTLPSHLSEQHQSSGSNATTSGMHQKSQKFTSDTPIEISDDEKPKSDIDEKPSKHSLAADDGLNSSKISVNNNFNNDYPADNHHHHHIKDEKGDISSPDRFASGVFTEREDKHEKRKDKEHKKGKKGKDGKIKKKKDKKDKSKSKDKAGKRKDREEKKDKDKLKKLKKEKKKEKMRALIYSSDDGKQVNDGGDCGAVPKLTLKLGINNSPQHSTHSSEERKLSSKSERRESSPELARISPLVTRPPKQKNLNQTTIQQQQSPPTVIQQQHNQHQISASNYLGGISNNQNQIIDGRYPSNISSSSVQYPSTFHSFSSSSNTTTITAMAMSYSGNSVDVVENSHRATAATSSSSSTLGRNNTTNSSNNNNSIINSHNSSNLYMNSSISVEPRNSNNNLWSSSKTNNFTPTTENNRPSSYIDDEGNQVWICPACGRVDDGTPMIGCDGCDAWYHWVCVGIQIPPDDNEDWYCRVCIAKKQEAHGADKKRKRKKKNKAN